MKHLYPYFFAPTIAIAIVGATLTAFAMGTRATLWMTIHLKQVPSSGYQGEAG